MRPALLISLPLLAACASAAQWNSTCTQINTVVCSHQLDCQLISDHADCVKEMEEQWFCDPEASLDELRLCKTSAPEAGCGQTMPEQCYEVLCDEISGCIETSVNTDSNPEGTPDP